MTILVTGASGFIGYYVSQQLLQRGYEVTGVDAMNDYYDPALKEARLEQLLQHPNFTFHKLQLEDRASVDQLFNDKKYDRVIHLAAQAGVRYSLINPYSYVQSNLVAFGNVLEACRHHRIEHLVYASSSSVYGANVKVPFSVQDPVNHPVSLYAATKKANELMAHSYSHLYGIPTTGLRFFTVYGPWGRPDMAYYSFTKRIMANEPIQLFNYGNMKRDFTYIDDIVEGIVRVMDHIPAADPTWNALQPDPGTSHAPYRVYNIGNHNPVELTSFISILEKLIGKKAIVELLPMQDGDVEATFADVEDLFEAVSFRPSTSLEVGLSRFVEWYSSYYQEAAVPSLTLS
ncbi:NAD-dependent epimerase [Paenibacillus sp. 1001270B_150601_E10]|uniref:NAD-dependent epimerase n=1 Tax=Paenibacillus sp. 1001270B_150601_E10 TaxID=2787079 RepID=UPI00189D9D7D|nr:NAD-dependent epimerase [Paenibacillus sp. 1001270B_150601_E10]